MFTISGLTNAYAKGAKLMKGQLIEGCPVQDIKLSNGSVQEVETAKGNVMQSTGRMIKTLNLLIPL